MRSGSGTSRATGTSDSGDLDSNGWAAVHSPSSSPSQPSAGSNSQFPTSSMGYGHVSNFSQTSQSSSTLSPFATRVRERDADAMEKYLRRNRSESQGTASTENKSQNGSYSSAGPSANGDDITSLTPIQSGTVTPRRLRPSISAAQLRAQPVASPISQLPEARSRSGTNPTSPRPNVLARSSSTSTSGSSHGALNPDDGRSYTGPPSQYATFPEPPDFDDSGSTPIASRRMAFHPGTRTSPALNDHLTAVASHRRGLSSASIRG